MQSVARVPRQARTRGLHREHGSPRTTGSALDRPVNARPRVRDPRQLRDSPGDLSDDRSLTDVVESSLGHRDPEQSESPIHLQSKLRRLRVIFSDRSFARQEHEGVPESYRQALLRAQRLQSGTDVEDLDQERNRMEICLRMRARHVRFLLRCKTFIVVKEVVQ